MQPRRRAARRGEKQTAEVDNRHITSPDAPQQDTIAKPESDELHPYYFRLKDSKGGGTYLSPVSSLDAARAELRSHWSNDLLAVTKLSK